MSPTTVASLQESLRELNLDTRGHKDQLKKRLRNATKGKTHGRTGPSPLPLSSPPSSSSSSLLPPHSAANKIDSDNDDSNMMYPSSPSPPYHYPYGPSSPFAYSSPPSPFSYPPSPPLLPQSPRPSRQTYDAFLVADFEATCERSTGTFDTFGYPNQIIEFAVVLLKWRRVGSGGESEDGSRPSSVSSIASAEGGGEGQMELYEVDSFRSYVKPMWRPTLSKFCTDLTGIQQHEVDRAPLFSEVLDQFHARFILPHNLFTPTCSTTWVTDGPWDLRDFVRKTLYINHLSRPRWLSGNYIDLRHSFAKYMNFLSSSSHSPSSPLPGARYHVQPNGTRKLLPSSPSSEFLAKAVGTTGIEHMLSRLALGAFEGTQHVGIDDTRNIARIVRELARRSWILRTTASLPGPEEEDRERRWEWMIGQGRVDWQHSAPVGVEAGVTAKTDEQVVDEVVKGFGQKGSDPIPIPIPMPIPIQTPIASPLSPPRSLPPPSLHDQRPPYGSYNRGLSSPTFGPSHPPHPHPYQPQPSTSPAMQFGSIPSPPLYPINAPPHPHSHPHPLPRTPTSPVLPLTPPTPPHPTTPPTKSDGGWYSAPPKAPSNFVAVRAGRRVVATRREPSPSPIKAAEPRSVVGLGAEREREWAESKPRQRRGRWVEREARSHGKLLAA